MTHPINNMTESEQIAAVGKHPMMVRAIKNPSEAVQWCALRASAAAIRYLDAPTEEMQLYAIGACPTYFESIRNPCRTAKLSAVRTKASALGLMHRLDIDDELVMEALRCHDDVIVFVWGFVDQSSEIAATHLIYHPFYRHTPQDLLDRAEEFLNEYCAGLGDVYLIGCGISMTKVEMTVSMLSHIETHQSPG